jgi:ABC-type bacteriocin/lantibiotic exporter with double-glycine peptidase domain
VQRSGIGCGDQVSRVTQQRPTTSLRQAARHTVFFVRFVSRTFPSFYSIVGLTLAVLVLEYAATSLMIPLSSGGAGAGSGVVGFWQDVLKSVGMVPEPRTWLWLFFIVMIGRLIVGYVQNISTTALGKKVHRVLSGRIFGHVVSDEPLTSVYTRSVGHYITLAGDDTFRCGSIIASILQCAVSLCTAAVALAVLYQFSTTVFFWIAAFLLVCSMTIALLFRYVIRLNTQSNSLSRELNTAFIESLNSLRSIRALHAERFVCANYARQIATYVRMLFRIEAVRLGIKSFPAILLLIVAAFLMRRGSSLTLSEASLLAVTIIVIRVFASMGQFVNAGTLLLTDVRAIGDIEALTRNAGPVEGTPALASNSRVDRIALERVDFGYGARTRILDKLTFEFVRGKTYAVVGPSGSGKSTLADVLLGLVRPDGGAIVVNGGAAPLASVRGRMMLVEQQPKIFSTTLRENLLFGFEAPDERLWEALRLVDLEHTARYMRDGLGTVLSYQGENFSGGQRQRIGIARALVRAPDVLILDEATSALDAATRQIVLGNVRAHMREGILILITHDPHLTNMADAVLDFRELASGPHVVAT